MRIVARPAHARRLPHPVWRDECAEGGTHVFGAAVAVEDSLTLRTSPRERVREHVTSLAGGPSTREPPREHAAGVLVHHDSEIAPAHSHAEIGDVADPHLIGRVTCVAQRRLGCCASRALMPAFPR